MEFGVFSVLLLDVRTSSPKEQEKDAPVLLAEDGAEKTTSCNERQIDEC